MDEKSLKKRVKVLSIFLIVILLIYLLYPHYSGMFTDGGSEIWEAKLYTVIHWNKLSVPEHENEKNGWKIYIWPYNNSWIK